MANPDPSQSSPSSLSALEAEVAELRAELRALRQQVTAPRAAPATTPIVPIASAPHAAIEAAAAPDATTSAKAAKRGTSRRGLLRGAAVAGAAAAAAVAVSAAAEPAHAAPLATGNNMVLGQGNDADSTTVLTPTIGYAPNPLLDVDNGSDYGVAVKGWSKSYFGAISGSGLSGGTGVWGDSDTGNGVVGNSASGIAINAVGAGRIAQNPQGTAGAPTSGSYFIGEQIRDSAGEMYLCVASGSPGTWVKVAHAAAGLRGGAITFLASPMRLLDTRGTGYPAYYSYTTPSPLGAGDWRYDINGDTYNSETIPSNATGVMGNVTVLNASVSGFISISAADVGFTGTANIAFAPGQIISNFFASAIGTYHFLFFTTTGIDVHVSAGPVDVIIDLFAVTL